MESGHKCKICGSKIALPSYKCLWCKYENLPQDYKESYKEAFDRLKKAFEEYRTTTDECIGLGQRNFFNEEKKVKLWKRISAVLFVLLVSMVVFALFK